MATETKTFYPGAYDASESDISSIENATNPVGKGSSNATYATIHPSASSDSCVIWPFDVSQIPENAVVDSVACTVKANNKAAYLTTHGYQLYCGSVAKGSVTSFLTTTVTTKPLVVGTWTREELNSIRLRIHLKGATTAVAYFYGADLTVTYTYQSEKFMLKINGEYYDADSVYQKIDGSWVEQEDLTDVMISENGIVNGGEYLSVYQNFNAYGNGVGEDTDGSSPECYIESLSNNKRYSNRTPMSWLLGSQARLVVCGGTDSEIRLNGVPVGVISAENSRRKEYIHTIERAATVHLSYTDTEPANAYIDISIKLPAYLKSKRIITFNIGNSSSWQGLQAEEGMQWEEWCESSYNTIGATIDVYAGDGYSYPIKIGNVYVYNKLATIKIVHQNVIIDGCTYQFVSE